MQLKLLLLIPVALLLGLLTHQEFPAESAIDIPSNPLRSIDHARLFFNRINAHNTLITSAKTDGEYHEFTFEGSETVVRAPKSLIARYTINQDQWKLYILYIDSTRQEASYLGINGISTVDVTVNPYEICPLTAILNLKLKAPGKIRVTILGRDSDSLDYSNTFDEISSHHPKVPVFGLYENFLNKVVISVLSPTGIFRFAKTITIQTDAIKNYPKFEVSKNEYPDNKNHFILMNVNVYDQQGYLRWRKVSPPPLPQSNFDVFPFTGDLFACRVSGESSSIIAIYTYLGELVKNYTVPNGYHHEIQEKVPGGNLLVATHTKGGFEDAITELDRETGEVVKFWDMSDYIDPNRPINWYVRKRSLEENDKYHLNTIRYDPTDNTLLISIKHQNLVTKIGYDDGKLKWLLSNHNEWADKFKPYLLTPIGFNTTLHPDQDWIYLQHCSYLEANGNIVIFDDGSSRPGFTNDPTEEIKKLLNQEYLKPTYALFAGIPHGYVRAVEYKVDPEKMTVEKVWEGTDFPTLPNTFIGGVHPLADDYIMIGYGEIQTVSVMHKPTKKTVFMGTFPKFKFYRPYPMEFYPEDAVVESSDMGIRGFYVLGLAASAILSLFIS